MLISLIMVYVLILSFAALIAASIAFNFLKRKSHLFYASSVLFIISAISSGLLFAQGYDQVVFGALHIYPFSMFFVALFSVSMLLVNALSYAYSSDYINLSLLISFSFFGTLIVASALSIIEIFIGLELITITTSFMILFEGKNRMEAALKFFILGSVSIAVFSFALVLAYPYNAQLTLSPLTQSPNLTGSYLVVLSIVLFIAAFGFDTALFPFNLWIPDVYEGAPTYITSLLAGINKKVAFIAMIEVLFFVFFAYKATFSTILIILSIFTMFFGNLLALVQKNVKRMFAYSSISQAGYILIGIATATQYGLEASIFYIVAHAFMIIGAFSIVLWMESKNIKTIDDYAALNSRNGFAAISLTIFMLSMAGIPPLIGFAGKYLLFSSAIAANMVVLAVIGIINSFISIYYYARLINAMFSRKAEKAIKTDVYIAAVATVALIVVIAFGVYPQFFTAIALKISTAFFSI